MLNFSWTFKFIGTFRQQFTWYISNCVWQNLIIYLKYKNTKYQKKIKEVVQSQRCANLWTYLPYKMSARSWRHNKYLHRSSSSSSSSSVSSSSLFDVIIFIEQNTLTSDIALQQEYSSISADDRNSNSLRLIGLHAENVQLPIRLWFWHHCHVPSPPVSNYQLQLRNKWQCFNAVKPGQVFL